MTAAPAIPAESVLFGLVSGVLGEHRAGAILSCLAIDHELVRGGNTVRRAELAMALNAALFSGLLDRVPTAAKYIAELRKVGQRVHFDHGALRAINGPTGALPPGYKAFARILEPLGYKFAATYPLPALGMTGMAFVHRDFPEGVPQFFLSELHVDQLAGEARVAAESVFGNSRDPLGDCERQALDALHETGECPLDIAAAALPGLADAFGRHHAAPRLADYHILLRHSPEAAWIATEGNVFNHAADRVADVDGLAQALRARGYPLKSAVEVSANGRVRQTAFLADWVKHHFRHEDGSDTVRDVPGSFYEFISREIDPATGKLDLSFDSGNATGIFTMTSAA